MADEPKLSAVEKIKLASNYLFGTLATELANDQDAFDKDSVHLVKHHGMYQQDDRDARVSKADEGKKSGRAYSLMVRVKIPGGVLSCSQFLAQLDLCDELGNSTLRITDRQDIQFHGVLKRDVREHVRRINAVQLTTLGACGDVERNVLCCPAPLKQDDRREQMQRLARQISGHLLPRSKAYHEIWLSDGANGEKQLVGGGEEVEPLYGKTYLPRKFKTVFALPEDNCIDIHANDLGFLAVCEGARIVGYNLLVGGGMGLTPSNKNTFAAVSQPLAFVTPEQVVDAVTAVVKIFRDFGNRADRKRARIKYLLHDWGAEKFKAQLDEYFGSPLPAPRPVTVQEVHDHLGWFEQGDGRWFYGLNVENGRVLDREGYTLKSALREICQTFQPGIRLTALQSILFTDLQAGDRSRLEAILRKHHVPLTEETSMVRRWSMACVALPTCPLAVTESERVMPALMDSLEQELAQLGLAGERFMTHMTGCPNGCARPYNCDIGLVGKTAGKYTIYLGGRVQGDRLSFIYKELVPLEQIPAALRPVFKCFRDERRQGESLGDFCHRKGLAGLTAAAAHDADPATVST
jgi:sulfite reductase (ferredoxin)